MPTLRIGTRQSRLALWQTEHVKVLLEAAHTDVICEVIPFVTKGDRTQAQDIPLPQIGGKGLFTLELERALRSGDIDFAVHSLKDLPVDDAAGLTLGAIVGRADVRDVVVAKNGWTLDTLPHGAKVGTGSLRRKAQLLAYRPDLNVVSIRGNVDTRIHKTLAGDYDAVVLAAAGVERLELQHLITHYLPPALILPAAGQGALGVQCRADDALTMRLLKKIENEALRLCTAAERAFLHALEGGCAVPVGALATYRNFPVRGSGAVSRQPLLTLQGVVGAPDGTVVIRRVASGDDPLAVGAALAAQLLAQGAQEILARG